MAVPREQVSSRLGFILVAAGSAAGIGSLVGFQLAATKDGGGASIFLYTLFVISICIPVMMAELSLGRATQKDPIGAYTKAAGAESAWRFAGFLAFLTPFIITVFYMVITIWVFGYFVEILFGNLRELADPNTFQIFINGKSIFIFLLVVVAMVNFILLKDVKGGIEAAAKIIMPAFLILLLGLVCFVLTLDNTFVGVSYYLIPDFFKINAAVLINALSQAFFSLSLGMGILVTYGSYVARQESIAIKQSRTTNTKMIDVNLIVAGDGFSIPQGRSCELICKLRLSL